MRRVVLPAVFLALNQALPANAENITVAIDRSQLMEIAGPASTIIIGNPGIADATILNKSTLVVTGHSFGTTNFIILDEAGKAIADRLVTVVRAEDDSVVIHRPGGRETFSCAPYCAPQISIGDAAASFDPLNSQIGARDNLAGGRSAGAGQ